jgi:hypothetical protein
MKKLSVVTLAILVLGCAPVRAPAAGPVVLHALDGTAVPLDSVLGAHEVTAVVFFSAECGCHRAHDPRLRELIAKASPRGVGFLVVDSERSASADRDAKEAAARGYSIVLDDDGKLARALDAEFATYSVVLDRSGRVLYRGGFDSDVMQLREDRATYLADALDDALAGRPLRRTETKALGCTLELR